METAERRMVSEKDGKLKSLLKKTYLTRWVGGSDGSDILAHLHNEKPHQVDFARLEWILESDGYHQLGGCGISMNNILNRCS